MPTEATRPPNERTIGVADLPVFLTEVELGEPLKPIAAQLAGGTIAKKTRALVRLHHQPIGHVILPAPYAESETVAAAIWQQLGPQLQSHLVATRQPVIESLSVDGLGPGPLRPGPLQQVAKLPFASIVIATRNRPEKIAASLSCLSALDYPSFEVIVAENGPTDGRTQAAVAATNDDRFRYVHDVGSGVSVGRNRGMHESTGDIIAFIDDDVRVDGWFLHAIAQGFQRAPNVGCVTGLVHPMHLNTIAELYVDQRLAWGDNLQPRIYDMHENRDDSPLYPYSAGIFGTGANFALSRSAITKVGDFDEVLGGSPTIGGEDLDMFLRVVRAGYSIVREPAAIVHHEHYSDLGVLRRQMFNYGRGFTAYLTKHMLNPRSATEIISRVPAGITRILKAKEHAESLDIVPPELAGREFRGMLAGPLTYSAARFRTQWSSRRNAHERGLT